MVPLASSRRHDPVTEELSDDEEKSLSLGERADDLEGQRGHRSKRRVPKLEVDRTEVEEQYYLKNEVLLDITAEPVGRPLPLLATNVRTKRKTRRHKMAADARYKDDTGIDAQVDDGTTFSDRADYGIATLTSLPV